VGHIFVGFLIRKSVLLSFCLSGWLSVCFVLIVWWFVCLLVYLGRTDGRTDGQK